MNINDVLNDDAKEVQTFEAAEKTAKKTNRIKGRGRPKKTTDTKAKPRVLYYTDEEFAKIERVAKLYDLSPSKYLKMIIKKELNREL